MAVASWTLRWARSNTAGGGATAGGGGLGSLWGAQHGGAAPALTGVVAAQERVAEDEEVVDPRSEVHDAEQALLRPGRRALRDDDVLVGRQGVLQACRGEAAAAAVVANED